MDFLVAYVERSGMASDDFPAGFYNISALSLLADKAELGKQAAAWLEENAKEAQYAPRMAEIDPFVRLLRKLLGG
jgi:hypothetical protein